MTVIAHLYGFYFLTYVKLFLLTKKLDDRMMDALSKQNWLAIDNHVNLTREKVYQKSHLSKEPV